MEHRDFHPCSSVFIRDFNFLTAKFAGTDSTPHPQSLSPVEAEREAGRCFRIRILAGTMQLADRRRLGGSRREQSARAIHTPYFGLAFREDFARWKRHAAAPFGRCEPPRRRRSYCIVTAQASAPRRFARTTRRRAFTRRRSRWIGLGADLRSSKYVVCGSGVRARSSGEVCFGSRPGVRSMPAR